LNYLKASELRGLQEQYFCRGLLNAKTEKR